MAPYPLTTGAVASQLSIASADVRCQPKSSYWGLRKFFGFNEEDMDRDEAEEVVANMAELWQELNNITGKTVFQLKEALVLANNFLWYRILRGSSAKGCNDLLERCQGSGIFVIEKIPTYVFSRSAECSPSHRSLEAPIFQRYDIIAYTNFIDVAQGQKEGQSPGSKRNLAKILVIMGMFKARQGTKDFAERLPAPVLQKFCCSILQPLS